MNYEFDTITAIATPVGAGGVGIIRVSGNNALNIVQAIFSKEIKTNSFTYGWIKEKNDPVDEVIVLYFKAPHSFTGEDVVEIQAHGGVNVLQKILNLVLINGARMAERGEFSKRAFLNGKIDLSKAEAILDLIHAKTSKFASKSAKNLSGKLAQEISTIKEVLFTTLAGIVAGIDFPEDMPEPSYESLNDALTQVKQKIEKILDSAKNSNIMRQGIKVAIVGRPNVGKSSLFNNLLSMQRAIVTDIAGTTRDVIQETLDVNGIPVTLIDTAGIREGEIDTVEKIGIDFTKQAVKDADLSLFLYDSEIGMTQDDEKIFDLVKDKNHIKIAAKSDLCSNRSDKNAIYLSNKTEENINILKNEISKAVMQTDLTETEFTTNNRQQECLRKALASTMIALDAIEREELQDLISIDVKAALLALDEITGEVITDDILNNIFDNFCIGK